MPQIGRVDTVHTHQSLHLFVLRKQSHERDRTSLQDVVQVFQQGERGALHQRHRFLGAQLWLLAKTLRGRFHQADQLGPLTNTHHLQRTLHLVQVLLGNADASGVDGIQVGCLRRFHIPRVAVQCLDRGFQRTTNFVADPCQWPEIPLFCWLCVFRFIFDSYRHATVPDCGSKINNRYVYAILNRDTDCRSSSAICDNSRTCCAVVRVPSLVCSVTAKIC